MVNPMRGEVAVSLDGVTFSARLTLGALAELEDRLAEPSMAALAERFESGRVSSRDVLELLAAALRAGGWQGVAADLVQADLCGSPAEAGRAAARLLARAFQVP